MDVLAGAGRISIAELRKALRRLGVRRQLSDDEIGRILRQSDKDGDGYVTLDEFAASSRLRSSPPPQAQRVVDMGMLPDGWEQMTTASQKRKALLLCRSGRSPMAYLARVKNALLYELSCSGNVSQVRLRRAQGMHQARQQKRKASKALIAWLDDEILRLLEGDRECLVALGQCMPDRGHRQPVWDDGEAGVPNFQLRPFGTQAEKYALSSILSNLRICRLSCGSARMIYEPESFTVFTSIDVLSGGRLHNDSDGTFSEPLKNPSSISFADLTASIAERAHTFSPDHIHQGCLGNWCARTHQYRSGPSNWIRCVLGSVRFLLDDGCTQLLLRRSCPTRQGRALLTVQQHARGC